MDVEHSSTSTNLTANNFQRTNSIRGSLSCQTSFEEPVQISPTSLLEKSPIQERSKTAGCLLGQRPNQRENFIWMQCKTGVLCTITSFNLLLVLILLDYWIAGRHRVALVLPWVVTLICGGLQLGALILDFVKNQVRTAKFSMDGMALYTVVILFVATNVLLGHLRSIKASTTLYFIDTCANAFLESMEHEKQVHKALAETEDSVDRISKMRHFISYVFHEIRVPFNVVMLGIGHLLALDITHEQQEILNMMDLSSSFMIRILNDVLDMGKIEAGKLHLEKQPFNMGEMVSYDTMGFQRYNGFKRSLQTIFQMRLSLPHAVGK